MRMLKRRDPLLLKGSLWVLPVETNDQVLHLFFTFNFKMIVIVTLFCCVHDARTRTRYHLQKCVGIWGLPCHILSSVSDWKRDCFNDQLICQCFIHHSRFWSKVGFQCPISEVKI
ncbi:hypothetical protein SAY86_010411 [Trapa natans]|uniref:Uncharacterized protein n=1 Tax=Trapa natans TaxID=22666 RepID=A0AAN7LT14_TRANT|nr:hypothetical protein SAY86_010411 [Trapa natans]